MNELWTVKFGQQNHHHHALKMKKLGRQRRVSNKTQCSM